jgi:hypothetical protein
MKIQERAEDTDPMSFLKFFIALFAADMMAGLCVAKSSRNGLRFIKLNCGSPGTQLAMILKKG